MIDMDLDMIQRAAVQIAREYESPQPDYDGKHYRDMAERVLLAAFGIREHRS